MKTIQKKGIRFLDLFAGAGGLSEGFIKTGFTPVAHVESDRAACFTLKTRAAYHWLNSNNQPEIYNRYLNGNLSREDLYSSVPGHVTRSVINSEIKEESLKDIFKNIDEVSDDLPIDLIIGGPPCQAYSVAGRARDKKKMLGDKRNYLYLYYAEFLKKYHPIFFVFENVTGLLSAKDGNGDFYLDKMLNLFRKVGYETEFMTLSAEDYGVPQNRKRVILVGKQGKNLGFYPTPEKWDPRITVGEIFSDLPPLKAGEGNAKYCFLDDYKGTYLYDSGIRNNQFTVTWHQARPHTNQDLEIYRIVVDMWDKNKIRINYNDLPDHLKSHNHRDSFLDRFKVVAAELPSAHTIVAHIAKDGHYYIHPDIRQNRSITPREAARIQTFPDDYYFESILGVPMRTPAFRQIGNAVPVLLAERVAIKLKEYWY